MLNKTVGIPTGTPMSVFVLFSSLPWILTPPSLQVILIPSLVGPTCLLLNDTLSSSQADHCLAITNRSYNLFLRPLREVSFLTGANVLDVAKIGIDGALMDSNVTQILGAYQHIHGEMVVQENIKADGIRADGSFGMDTINWGLFFISRIDMPGQHGGVLYNGNYGRPLCHGCISVPDL
jgi:hypothetical protein